MAKRLPMGHESRGGQALHTVRKAIISSALVMKTKFLDDADRLRFVETLAEACAKTAWQAHAADDGVDGGALGDGHSGLSEPPALTPYAGRWHPTHDADAAGRNGDPSSTGETARTTAIPRIHPKNGS